MRVPLDVDGESDAYTRGLWVRTTLADSLREAARLTPQRTVLIDGHNRLNCQTLNDQANALAQTLMARMPPGSVISFMLPNWHEAAVIYLAATLAGMVVNPILPSLRDRELRFILDDAQSRMVFVPCHFGRQDYPSMLVRVTAHMDTPPEVVVLRGEPGGHTAYESLFSAHLPGKELPALDPGTVRMVLYTSGTTGHPKGVLHSHNSIHALIWQVREYWCVEPGDRFLVPSPIAHIGGSIYAFECPLLLGTTAVLMDRWNADDAVKLMTAERCTHMAGATPFLERLLASAERAGTHLPAPEIADSLGLKRPTGALVASLTAGSPAARSGLKTGDLITAVDGQEVEDPNAFDYRFATKPLGGNAHLGVVRSGKEVALAVPLEPLPDTPHDELVIQGRSPFQGAKISNLSPALADDMRLDPSTDGVVITEVGEGSAAQGLGFHRGDVVLSVNNQKISKTRDLERATNQPSRVWRITIIRGGQQMSVVLSG